jgi:hypothetical protein
MPLPLQDAQIAAVYSGNPATGLTSGLLRGFLRESDAGQIVLPASLPIVGGRLLSSILPGGSGSCANHNGRDILNGVSGWWLYINFQAARVPWTE